MSYRMIHVGTGGFGKSWCESFLPQNIRDGHVEVVAAVDIDPDTLENAKRLLRLPADRCYTDIRKAFDENQADFCTVVIPPGQRATVSGKNATRSRGCLMPRLGAVSKSSRQAQVAKMPPF